MFKLTQASQERMAGLFANGSKAVKISCGYLEIGFLQFSCLWYFDAIYEFYFASCYQCKNVNNSLLAFHGIHIMFSFKDYNFFIVQIIGIELMIMATHYLERGIYNAFISISTPKF